MSVDPGRCSGLTKAGTPLRPRRGWPASNSCDAPTRAEARESALMLTSSASDHRVRRHQNERPITRIMRPRRAILPTSSKLLLVRWPIGVTSEHPHEATELPVPGASSPIRTSTKIPRRQAAPVLPRAVRRTTGDRCRRNSRSQTEEG